MCTVYATAVCADLQVLTELCVRPYATSVCGLTLLVDEDVCVLTLLLYANCV